MRLCFCVTASFNASDFKAGRETVIEELRRTEIHDLPGLHASRDASPHGLVNR
jgi:hypothetical protein